MAVFLESVRKYCWSPLQEMFGRRSLPNPRLSEIKPGIKLECAERAEFKEQSSIRATWGVSYRMKRSIPVGAIRTRDQGCRRRWLRSEMRNILRLFNWWWYLFKITPPVPPHYDDDDDDLPEHLILFINRLQSVSIVWKYSFKKHLWFNLFLPLKFGRLKYT